jgi:hypothetical protein
MLQLLISHHRFVCEWVDILQVSDAWFYKPTINKSSNQQCQTSFKYFIKHARCSDSKLDVHAKKYLHILNMRINTSLIYNYFNKTLEKLFFCKFDNKNATEVKKKSFLDRNLKFLEHHEPTTKIFGKMYFPPGFLIHLHTSNV